MRRFVLSFIFAALACFSVATNAAQAQEDDQPILTVDINLDGIKARSEFTMADLQAFEPTRFVTSTIWTDGQIEFEGLAVDALLDHLNVTQGRLELIAQNDYFLEIPIEELRGTEGLLAYSKNGAPMSTRDKGPLWLVFPFDKDVDFQSELFYARSIWQLNRITVLP